MLVQAQGFTMNPEMMKMMKEFDSNEMNKQLDSLGLSPSDVRSLLVPLLCPPL